MKVISDEQLDFDDVSIEPKRSSLNSRSEVELVRTYAWTGVSGEKHTLTCKPMCVANMGTVGTPEMAERVTASGYMCALEKHLSKEDVDSLFGRLESKAEAIGMGKSFFTDLVAMSIGIRESLDNLVYIDSRHKLNIINLDAPNGYCPNFTKRLTELRNAFPEAFIIAGTVVTGDIVTDLIMKGANAVRVGICCGCFQGDMKVMTDKGLKSIKDIDVDEKVLTHTGKFQVVTNKFIFNTHKHLIEINGIKCTPDHKFYVADVDDLKKINEQNYKKYCKWIPAKDLDVKKHKLIKIKDTQ